jgi:hypothetical protein
VKIFRDFKSALKHKLEQSFERTNLGEFKSCIQNKWTIFNLDYPIQFYDSQRIYWKTDLEPVFIVNGEMISPFNLKIVIQ